MKKILFRSVLVFLLAYVMLFLLISLPGLKRPVANLFLDMANAVIPKTLSEAFLVFEQNPGTPNDPDQIRVRMESMQMVEEQKAMARNRGLKTIDLNFKTYNIFLFEFYLLPLLFYSALVIATPVRLQRRLIALFAGLPALHLFLLLKTYFITLYYLQQRQITGFEMTPLRAELLERTQLVFNNITTAMIVATLIWSVALITKQDWRRLNARLNEKGKH